jgi:hypothetical protein
MCQFFCFFFLSFFFYLKFGDFFVQIKAELVKFNIKIKSENFQKHFEVFFFFFFGSIIKNTGRDYSNTIVFILVP